MMSNLFSISPKNNSGAYTHGVKKFCMRKDAMSVIFSYFTVTELIDVVCKLSKMHRQLLVVTNVMDQPRSLTVDGNHIIKHLSNYKYIIQLANKNINLKVNSHTNAIFVDHLLYLLKE